MTSEVLTLLNNELIITILNSIPYRLKIRKHFRLKKHKSQFCLIEWFKVFVVKIKSFIFYTFWQKYTKTLGAL